MTQSKLITAALGLLALAAVSCKKAPEPVPAVLSIEISDITATGATVTVSAEGDAPTLVRFFSATEKASIDFDLNDASLVATYATKNGAAISVPYSATMTGLEPFVEYAVGAVAYDADMKITSAVSNTFQTAAPDNAIGEEGSGAGSLTDRTL